MKSPMIEQGELVKSEDKGNKYSELQVLHSSAGYYLGTIYTDKDGFQEPGSRDSGYFPKREQAEAELKKLERGELVQLRMRP